jgi:hypothetical protein
MLNPFEQLRIHLPAPEHHFEEIASHILRKTIPDAKRVRVHQGDAGVDTFTGEWGATGALDVYQIKYFTTKWGSSQRQQIKESFQTAAGSRLYNLARWILVVPTNPTAADYEWFYTWKAEAGANIDIIDGSNLNDRLELPECASARQLLQKWDIAGVTGGPHVVPVVHVRRADHLPVVLLLHLENHGDRTARQMKIRVTHSETHTVARSARREIWRDDGGGRLNPRSLTALRDLNPGESMDVFGIPFKEIPSIPVEISIKLTAEDAPPLAISRKFEPELLVVGNTLNFHEQEPDAVPTVIAPEKVVGNEELSETAKSILDLLKKLGPFSEPALHVIAGHFPGDATQTGFLVGETGPARGTPHRVKTRLFEPALQELIEKGYLHEPVDGPGTLVFEFKAEAIAP